VRCFSVCSPSFLFSLLMNESLCGKKRAPTSLDGVGRAPAPPKLFCFDTGHYLWCHLHLFLTMARAGREGVSPPNCKRLLLHLVIIYFDRIFTHLSVERHPVWGDVVKRMHHYRNKRFFFRFIQNISDYFTDLCLAIHLLLHKTKLIF
jgi:hypothetical protein